MADSRTRTVLAVLALTLAVGATWLGVSILSPPPAAPAPLAAPVAPAKPALAQPLAPEPEEPVLRPGQSADLLVLMYHHIGAPPARARGWARDLYVTAERFEHDVSRLQTNRCCAMTMAQAYRLIAQERLPKQAVVITFDDGYEDNYTLAVPILRRHGMLATFNVVVSKIGDGKHMNRAQLRELVQAGNDIGCHSLTHPDLRRISDDQVEREVVGAKHDLEQVLGRRVVTYCYPDGKYDERTLAAVEQADYKVALTTGLRSGRVETSRPFEVGRYRVTMRKEIPPALLLARSEPSRHE